MTGSTLELEHSLKYWVAIVSVGITRRVEVSLSPDDVVSRLRACVGPRGTFRRANKGRVFEGDVSSGAFDITPVFNYWSSAMLVLRGRLTPAPRGTRIELYIGPSLMTKFVPLLTIIAVVACGLISISQSKALSVSPMVLIAAPLILASMPLPCEGRAAVSRLMNSLSVEGDREMQ